MRNIISNTLSNSKLRKYWNFLFAIDYSSESRKCSIINEILYKTNLVTIMSASFPGCSPVCENDSGLNEEATVSAASWSNDLYSFHEAVALCSSLATTFDASAFCTGLESRDDNTDLSSYDTCIDTYTRFQTKANSIMTYFPESSTKVTFAESSFVSSYYKGEILAITFFDEETKLLLSCNAYHITEGCADSYDYYAIGNLCYSSNADQPASSPVLCRESNPYFSSAYLSISVDSSFCPDIPGEGVQLTYSSSWYQSSAVPVDLVILQTRYSEGIQDLVSALFQEKNACEKTD